MLPKPGQNHRGNQVRGGGHPIPVWRPVEAAQKIPGRKCPAVSSCQSQPTEGRVLWPLTGPSLPWCHPEEALVPGLPVGWEVAMRKLTVPGADHRVPGKEAGSPGPASW